jgi:hypothetical protein
MWAAVNRENEWTVGQKKSILSISPEPGIDPKKKKKKNKNKERLHLVCSYLIRRTHTHTQDINMKG